MAVSKAKKEEVVKQLEDLFKDSKSVVFSDYGGISVKGMGDLRQKLRENEVQFKVAKRTLIKLAADSAGFKDIPDHVFEGQVGVAFSLGDEVGAAKTLYEFSKDNKNLELLGALMEGRALTKEETLELAKIPGKDELLAKLVGSIKSPISGFHGTLHSLVRSLVGVVSAYKDKVEAEEPAPATEEPKAEEAAPADDKPAEEEKPAEEAAPEAEEKTEEPADEAPAEDEKPTEEEQK